MVLIAARLKSGCALCKGIGGSNSPPEYARRASFARLSLSKLFFRPQYRPDLQWRRESYFLSNCYLLPVLFERLRGERNALSRPAGRWDYEHVLADPFRPIFVVTFCYGGMPFS